MSKDSKKLLAVAVGLVILTTLWAVSLAKAFTPVADQVEQHGMKSIVDKIWLGKELK